MKQMNKQNKYTRLCGILLRKIKLRKMQLNKVI